MKTKLLLTTIAAVLLVGWGKSQESSISTKPNYPGTQTAILAPEVGSGVIKLELKPDNLFIEGPEDKDGGIVFGTWEVSDNQLVCEGIMEDVVVVLKVQKNTLKLSLLSTNGKEMPVENGDGIYFTKNKQ